MPVKRSRVTKLYSAGRVAFRSINDLTEREKKYLLQEISMGIRALLKSLLSGLKRKKWIWLFCAET